MLQSAAQCPGGDQCQVLILSDLYTDQYYLAPLLVTWRMGLSALSASLWKTPSCVVWSTCWREGIPHRETWASSRGGSVRKKHAKQGQMQEPPHGSGQCQALI